MTKTTSPITARILVQAAVCLALCLVLPFLTGQIPQIGAALSPMHIPVLLCGYLCGGPVAALVGFVAPLFRYLLFGMPTFPTCFSMAFELCAYGFFSGLLYRLLPKKTANIYISLIFAMILGRIVWGVAQATVFGLTGQIFTLTLFWAGAVTNAIPGIVCHIILVPLLVIALRKSGTLEE